MHCSFQIPYDRMVQSLVGLDLGWICPWLDWSLLGLFLGWVNLRFDQSLVGLVLGWISPWLNWSLLGLVLGPIIIDNTIDNRK